jgi:thioredoxin reductase (NADPH)
MFLADGGSSVTLLIRSSDLGKNMSRYLVDRIGASPRIDVRLSSQVTGLAGEGSLSAVHVAGPEDEVVLPCSGLFSLIGADPSSDWLSGCAALDEHGFVLTDLELNEMHLDENWRAVGRRPLPFETSRPGLFAVGDLRSGSMKRVASAVGEGSAAVRSVHQYLAFET